MPTITVENSFATIAEANTMIDEVYGAEEWAGLSDDQKTRLLITATAMLRELVYKDALADGVSIWTHPILKEATAFQAWFIYQHNDAMESAMSDGVGGVVSKTVGRMTEEKAGAGFAFRKQYHPRVLRLLQGYYPVGKAIVRG